MALQNKVSSENTYFCPTCANPIAPTLHNAPILHLNKTRKSNVQTKDVFDFHALYMQGSRLKNG